MPVSGSIFEILLPILRLVVLTLAGFIVFRIHPVRQHALKPFVWAVLNLIFPLYFIHTYPSLWAAGNDAGWVWAGIFAAAYLVFFAVQMLLGRLLINRVSILQSEYPREFLVIFAMHNAGYVPLPIVAALAPAVVSLYLTFYIIPFMVLFFTLGAWLIQGAGGGKTRLPINGPIVGIVLGLVLAITGVYPQFPTWFRGAVGFVSSFALDAVMVVLGAILGSIPRAAIRYRREFGGYVLVKMIIFPVVVFAVMATVRFRALSPDVAAGVKLAMIVEAAVPPATNIMVLTQAYGTREQVEYAGSAIIYSYLAAIVTIPLFLVLTVLVIG